MLYSRTWLFIHSFYTSLHLTSLNSQSIPFLNTLWQLGVCFLRVCPTHRCAHLCCILDSTYKWDHVLFASFWLTSLSVIISRSTHVASNGSLFHSFSWLSNIPLCVYTTDLFIHLSVDGRLGYLYILATVNSTSSSHFWVGYPVSVPATFREPIPGLALSLTLKFLYIL